MQRPTFRSSQNLILGLSLVGILCSCSGTSSGSDDAYDPEPSRSSSYTEPEPSYQIEEEETTAAEEEPVPYEDGELAFTQEELEYLEALQRSQEQGYQLEQSFTDAIDQGNQELHEEQIMLEREQLDSKRFGLAQESIINNYSTFCPSTGPCN